MTNCNHQFVLVKRDVDYIYKVNPVPPTQTASISKLSSHPEEVPNSIHAIVVCAWCGHVRHVYANGNIKVIKDHGETIQSV